MSGTRVPPRDHPGGFAKPTGKCRQCEGPVAPPRRTFCSDHCVHLWKLRTDSGYRREHVFKRDGGICGQCRRDCHALERDLTTMLYGDPSKLDAELARLGLRRRTPEEVDHRRGRYDAALVASLRAEELVDKRLPAWGPGMALWHADHVVGVFEGGGSTGLENMQTLCLWCHRDKTAEQARKRAASKRVEVPDEIFPADGGPSPGFFDP